MNLVAVVIGCWIAWLPPTGAVGPDLSGRDALRVPPASQTNDAWLAASSPAEDDDPTDGEALDLAIARPVSCVEAGGPTVSSPLSDAIRPPCPRTFPIRC